MKSMKLNKASHKAFLNNLFYIQGMKGVQEKSFPLSKMKEAASCSKKLKDQIVEENVKGQKQYNFKDGTIEFDIDELKLLKDLIAEIKELTLAMYEVYKEVKELIK